MRLRSLWRRGTSLLTLVVLLGGALVPAPAAGAHQASSGTTDSVTAGGFSRALAVGVGRTTLTAENFPDEYAGDTVRVGLAAHMFANQPARGTFFVTHREPTGELLADVSGNIECMRIEGEYAVTIGRITDVEKAPEAEVSEGDIAAVIVQDNGSGNDTMAWVFGPADTPVNCAEIPAETTVPVEQGRFRRA